MKNDVRKLKYSGQYESEFSFDYLPNISEISSYGVGIDGAVKVTGFVELHGEDVYVEGTISCTIVGKCARCLEDASEKFSVNYQTKYVLFDASEDEYLYKSGVVDLTEMVNDILLTEMPTILYCKADCKGLCPVCGENLNKSQCKCKN